MKQKEQKYTLTVTEKQLMLIANCIEDISRFLAGQTELWHTCTCLENRMEIRSKLKEIKSLVTPDLPENGFYSWCGGGCENKKQAEYIAKTYTIYREILHKITVLNKSDNEEYNVYNSPTLTSELGGKLPKIEKLD